MQLDHRNVHGKIFGGYLMRKAYEAGWASVAVLLAGEPGPEAGAGAAPAFGLGRMSEVHFLRPVDVGDLLQITARPVYAVDSTVVVMVECGVGAGGRGVQPTNRLFFEFALTGASAPSAPLVEPVTYADCVRFLAGRRQYRIARGLPVGG